MKIRKKRYFFLKIRKKELLFKISKIKKENAFQVIRMSLII